MFKIGKNLDPLFVLFEHHLATRSHENSEAFTKRVAEQYMAYLDSTPAHVPFHVRSHLLEDLTQETQSLLIKKMYGCVRSQDYSNMGNVASVEGTPAATPEEASSEDASDSE